jgi:hypothetical protein
MLSAVMAATFAFLAFLSLGGAVYFMAAAHAQDEACICPEPQACPPEGYRLVKIQTEDTTMQEALDAIRAAREHTQEK